MVDKALFSSDSSEWETPSWLYTLLDQEFHFTLDPCATDDNAKAPDYFTVEEDGLLQDWSKDVVFVNPPFSKVSDWVAKAHRESVKGATVVVLMASRTDTAYWHEHVMKAHCVRFIRGRLKFVGAESSAPFPSVVVIFRSTLGIGLVGVDAIDARGKK